MVDRSHIIAVALAIIYLILPTVVLAQQVLSAATRLNKLGPENTRMAGRVGTWDVVETIWAAPGAKPTATKYVAERRMIGQFLQEIVGPTPGSAVANFRRIYYLSFNRVEGCWKYVSMDTRNPVGLMPARSSGPGDAKKIDLVFDPFALPGAGAAVTGQLLHMEEIMVQQDADHDYAEERFRPADSRGTVWVGYRYDYTRRRVPLK